MAAFLHDPLRLSLKPAKTHHVCVADGMDFLGFRLSGGVVTIQPEKLDRVTSALHSSLAVLGAPHASFLERMKTLGRINSLIRGFRAYFCLPDEPPILPQLRHLDRTVDELAEETLPEELRDDPAWLARERFTANAPEDDATAPPIAQNVYPEERAPSGPLNWMVKDDHLQAGAPAVVPTPPARVESPADADTPTERAAIVEHEGRVYVMTHGAYVTESDGALVVKHRRVEIFRKALDQVSLLFLQGLGTSLSLSLASECAKRDVALVVAQPIGAPLGVLNPVDSARAHLRGRQVLRRNDPDVIRAGLRMLGAKAGNQAAILRYFAKYRVKTDAELYRRLVAASDEVRGLGHRLEQVGAGAAGVRATAMGFEGQAAATYWSHLALLLPAGAGFKGRVTRDAGDPVNQAINYVYGMLYGEVWRALVKAGLDPYFGIMHGSERDQGSLVFDLIEEFRAPFADRLVVALISRGLKIPTPGGDGLRLRARRVLARSFIQSWTRKIRWRGRPVAPAGILQHQAGALVKLINGDADYRPFRMRW